MEGERGGGGMGQRYIVKDNSTSCTKQSLNNRSGNEGG